jgi:hypothetical protein
MRIRHALALLSLGIGGVSCQQLLGIEKAYVICDQDEEQCRVCEEPEDCAPSTDCHRWTCRDNLCVPLNLASRTPCAGGLCSDDWASECVQCVVAQDCTSGYCFNHECFRCDDGIQNGNEDAVDCGGECKGCLGSFCSNAAECISGFCADGHCCNSACMDTCASCNNSEGDCKSLPKYENDENPSCKGNSTCTGSGACLGAPGTLCFSEVECASFRCVANRCAMLPGEACLQESECANDACVNGVCAE